jgi:hypothetical protein
LDDEVVEAVHDFLHGGVVVPPMHVEDVKVRCAETLQARFDGQPKRLEVVTRKVGLHGYIVATSHKGCGVLWTRLIRRRSRLGAVFGSQPLWR